MIWLLGKRKENGNYSIVYWGYIGIMEEEMETLCSILGLSRDNGKGSGNYYVVYWGYVGIMEKEMETTM